MNLKLKTLVLALGVLMACQQKETKTPNKNQDSIVSTTTDAHQAKNSLDYVGTYKGVLPCADCGGIETTVVLNENNTYNIKTKYIDKGDKVFEEKGTFTWDQSGNKIVLNEKENTPTYYQVGENTLTQLDIEGKKVTGVLAEHYVLSKQPSSTTIEGTQQTNQPTVNLDERIETQTVIKKGNPAVGKYTLAETKWKLKELNGKQVVQKDKKDYFIKMNSKDGRFSAYAGCNNFMGMYSMKSSTALSFSSVATTMMACPEMDLEQKFAQMLEKIDHYNIVENQLHLIKGKKIIARFEAIK